MAQIINSIYNNDIENICNLELPWDKIKNKTFLISGITGMVGIVILDVLMKRNTLYGDNIKVIGISRNNIIAKNKFQNYLDKGSLKIIEQDINKGININDEKVDYIIHAASNTHPIEYSTDPIGTIMTNVVGTNNLLDLGVKNNIERFVFLSSVEVYGDDKTNIALFDEESLGYINCNTLRAGYPESKRTGEALCNAYAYKNNLNFVIARLSRLYGPTMSMDDSKVISQFIKKAINKEDIVLKSSGEQKFSFNYVVDAVSAIFTILFLGENKEAYNVSDLNSDITLLELARKIAKKMEVGVNFENPSLEELKGYSKSKVAMMDSSKLKLLGWECQNSIDVGIDKTINILLDNRKQLKGR